MTTLIKVQLAEFTKAGHKIHTCAYGLPNGKPCGNRYLKTMREQDEINICMKCLYNQ